MRQRSRNRVSQRHLGEPRDLRIFGTVPSSPSSWGGVVAASSAIRPDSPETGGVALPGLRPGPDLHNQGNVEGDGGGGEGTKRGRPWDTKESHAMRWWSSFLRAHNIDMSSHSSCRRKTSKLLGSATNCRRETSRILGLPINCRCDSGECNSTAVTRQDTHLAQRVTPVTSKGGTAQTWAQGPWT